MVPSQILLVILFFTFPQVQAVNTNCPNFSTDRQTQKKKKRVTRIPHCTIVHQGIWSHSTRPASIMRGVRDCHRSGSRLCKDDAGIVQANIVGGTAWCRVDHWAMDRPGWGRDLEGMHWQQSHIVHGRILSWWWLGKVIYRQLDLMRGLGSLLRWAKFGLGSWLGWSLGNGSWLGRVLLKWLGLGRIRWWIRLQREKKDTFLNSFINILIL